MNRKNKKSILLITLLLLAVMIPLYNPIPMVEAAPAGDLYKFLRYDGTDDYVIVGDSVSLNMTGGDMTVELWLRLSSPGPGDVNMLYKMSEDYGDNGWAMWYDAYTLEEISVLVNDGVGGDNELTYGYAYDTSWHHYLFMFNNTDNSLWLWIDGVYKATLTENPTANYDSIGDLLIATNPGPPSDSFIEGDIDEVRIYSRRLTQAEITYSFANKEPQNQAGLVLWLRFNEGTGDTAYDETANDNDGTLMPDYPSNAPEWIDETPTAVSIDTSEDFIVTFQGNQRKLVRTSDGTLYAVYHKELATKEQVYIKHSTNYGASWTGETLLSTGLESSLNRYPSIAVDGDDNLHVVWDGVREAYYVKYSTASSTWSTPIAISTLPSMDGYEQDWLTISVDSSDNLHVVWDGTTSDFFFGHNQIWYAKYTDTWSDPLHLSTIPDMENRTQVWPAMAIDSNDYIHVGWVGSIDPVGAQSQIWYTNYTTSWSTPYNISIDADLTGALDSPSICVDYNDNLQVVWSGEPTAVGYDHDAVWYTNYTTTWSTPIIISNATGMEDYEQAESTITVDLNDYLHVFWTGKATEYSDDWKVWYANYTIAWITPICLQPTGRNAYPNSRWSLYPSFNRVGFTIDYVFTEGTGAYDVMYDRLLLPPITNFSITNMEGCGAWVFQSRKDYIFSLNVSHEGDGALFSAGVGFYDEAGDWYSVFYDNSTGEVTVVSPDDGISASLRSVSTGVDWLNVTFSIMLNPAIADTLNADAYIRYVTPVYGDSGWVVREADYFNIYNLGGFATLTKSGWADRTTGGDVFEIYAADTRTKNLIPLENFDVREGPLSTGVWMWGWGWITPPGDEDALLDELVGWKTWMTSRTPNHTIRPTNRLPDTGVAGEDTTYYSEPFGLLIKSTSTLNQSLMMEKEFARTVKTTDGDLVIVEFWATVANDTKITGQVLISDDGYVDDLEQHVVTDTLRIVDFKFYGNGSIRLVDGVSNIYPATYSGMVWANYTFVMNLTAQTYDFYVDEVLNATGVDFREAASSVGHITFLDTLNPVFPAQPVEFYIDDLKAYTDFDGNFGGDAKATSLFRYLQHWSMDWDFKVEEGREFVRGPTSTPWDATDDYSDHGFIELGWDICLNDTWEDNFLVARINITDGMVLEKSNWVQFNVTWTQNGTYAKHDIIYGYFEGYKLEIQPGDVKDTTGWYFDMWFNRMNASTVVGGRLNAEYFGMTNKPTFSWGSNWKPVYSDFTESSCFVDLLDSNDVIHSAKEVSLVRPWVRVFRTNQSTFHYAIANTETEFRTTKDTMSGIDTPPIQETITPQGASTGGLGPYLASAINKIMGGLGDTIQGIMVMVTDNLATSALTGFMVLLSTFIAFVDNITAALGYPGLASTALGIVTSGFDFLITMITEGYIFTIIGNIFTVVTSTFGHILLWFTRVITTFTNIFTITWGIIDGTYVGVGDVIDLWGTFNWAEWSDAMPIFMIVAWFNSIDQRHRKAGGGWMAFFFADLRIIRDFAYVLLDVSIWVINNTIVLVERIVNMIPGM